MKVLLIGASGQLGKEVLKRLSKYEIYAPTSKELDITLFCSVETYINQTKPNIIINCAAHTNVDLCEMDSDKAHKVNALGPRNLALVAAENKSILVHISTDYVFDGCGIRENGELRPYIEYDLPNPISVYGSSKYEGENYIKSLMHQYFIIRTSWLYGEGKNFIQAILNQCKIKDEIKVVNDQYGTPTSTYELANLIDKLIMTKQYGLYHGTCEGSCTWYEFACEIVKMNQLNTKVLPISTEELNQKAKRPKYSVLSNKLLEYTGLYQFENWKAALNYYFERI